MDSESRQKIVFCSHSGLYKLNVMPFGLCNALATFQRLMEAALVGLAREKCIVYLDGILVMGRTFEEHLDNLAQVLSQVKQAGLRLKPRKCHLAKRKVCHLGYVVFNEGISADPVKGEAVKSFATPTDVKPLRAFLGLASYYRRFIPSFSRVAAAFFLLIGRCCVPVGDKRCQNSFDRLKGLLIQAPLTFPDFTKPFVLETDASGQRLGAVLSQQQENGLVASTDSLCQSDTTEARTELWGHRVRSTIGMVWAI